MTTRITAAGCAAAALLAACSGQISATPATDDATAIAALSGKSDVAVPTKAWTILFYGAGDNNLGDEMLAALNDIEAVGSTAQVNFVAFLDHPTRNAARYYLTRDDDPAVLHSPSFELGDVDSGDPQTLIYFTTWAVANYPARRYALFVNGHGGLSPRRLAFDEKTGNSMSIDDLWRAIDTVHQRTGARLDLLATDTCLTETVETAVELDDDVDVVVGSENEDYGWDYGALARTVTARPDHFAADLGRSIVKAYSQYGKYPGLQPLTMAALQTKKMDDMAAAVSLLGDALVTYMQGAPEQRDAVVAAAFAVYRPLGGESYADVRDLMARLEAAVDDENILYLADQVDRIAVAATIAQYVTPGQDGAYGVSIFLPLNDSDPPDQLDAYRLTRFGAASHWGDFVAQINAHF